MPDLVDRINSVLKKLCHFELIIFVHLGSSIYPHLIRSLLANCGFIFTGDILYLEEV